MRIFSAELVHNYDSYTFGYANYCEREKGDTLNEIYDRGYLPYSGAKDVRNLFYMARSARIDLSRFDLDSENRRIAKKFDAMFSREIIGIASDDIRTLFLEYFVRRHGSVMPAERLDLILDSGLPPSIISYSKVNRTIAAIIEVAEGSMGHFWFSAYAEEYDKSSFGLWLMLDCLREARSRGLSHYYLGTLYGEKALYKTNFAPLEWWDGTSWSNDLAVLKTLGKSDSDRTISLTDRHKADLEPFVDR